MIIQEDIDIYGVEQIFCPVTQSVCIHDEDQFCDDYGCARLAGIDVDRAD